MAKYIPALKGKKGELEALWNLSDFDSVLPLLEVVDAEEGGASRLGSYLRKVPRSATVAVDGGPSRAKALLEVEEELRTERDLKSIPLDPREISIIPTIRHSDGDADLEIFQRINERHRSGYLLRLGSTEADPDVAEAESRVPLLLSKLGAAPGEIDLVLDYAAVDSERTVERITPGARQAVLWAKSHRWRSITLLSGSFPPSISALSYEHETVLPRLEVALWRAVSGGIPGGNELWYGDYATNHPTLQPGAGSRKSNPNLRYARGEKWIIHRRRAHLAQGNLPFYEICRTVVDDPEWEGEAFSWADRQIARGAHTYTGLGNATKWVALGRSRHLEVVKRRLATLGEP
ncbi:beta family protein [Nocardiopsis changdeensis]|uniref:beta family protein n=1 Tax=Nocardiopsis changdeensis TaxID=2831969 RepID=UPI003F466417